MSDFHVKKDLNIMCDHRL